MSESLKGKNTGENNPMFGKTHSEEARKKMSESLKGRTLSEEHRIKISEAKKRKTFSEEHRKKISDSLKGRILSEEHRRKMRDAKLEYWERKRQEAELTSQSDSFTV